VTEIVKCTCDFRECAACNEGKHHVCGNCTILDHQATLRSHTDEKELDELVKKLKSELDQSKRRVPRYSNSEGEVGRLGLPPLVPSFQIMDSGKREQFESGMVRDVDDDKVDYARVFDGPMLHRWADHLTKGAKKYPDDPDGHPNWMKASNGPELTRAFKSAFRHFMQWYALVKLGIILPGCDPAEDHAAAVIFNINEVEYIVSKQQGQDPRR
jgi:hypothetical protein